MFCFHFTNRFHGFTPLILHFAVNVDYFCYFLNAAYEYVFTKMAAALSIKYVLMNLLLTVVLLVYFLMWMPPRPRRGQPFVRVTGGRIHPPVSTTTNK